MLETVTGTDFPREARTSRAVRIGIDTGGTFTDCVVAEGPHLRIAKIFSTPEDATEATLDGIRQLTGPHALATRDLEVIHGTTVGTNTLLERRGARVALVTTAGFEDLIEIGRQNRPRLYDLNVQREPPLVPRRLRWGVRERSIHNGRVVLKIRPAEPRRLRKQIQRSGAESVALCFLFSFANPSNERAVARALRELAIPVSVSHEILPEFREYERLSTVVINAYLAPRLGAYLSRLEGAVNTSGGRTARTAGAGRSEGARVFVMQSNGGITTAAQASREPVRTVLSGPAGGVVAAAWLAKRLGMPRAISFDMGGTSTDVCLFEGSPRATNESTLAGLPVAVPAIDIHSVGAGGGSLARLDAAGALRVGPESAGAAPGPICYGRGGTRPTVTDAHLILGRLDPDYFLGGTFRLDTHKTESNFADFLHRAFHGRKNRMRLKSSLDLARGIVAVSNAAMERALRVISVERGHDPRDFALICFGGAGGLHAADLARSLGVRRVVIPQNPGAFSALGILLSDIVKDFSQSVLLSVPENRTSRQAHRGRLGAGEFRSFLNSLRARFGELEEAAQTKLRMQHAPGAAGRRLNGFKMTRGLDLRYAGQAYELSVPFTSNFPELFRLEHERTYGYAHEHQPREIGNLRVRITLPTIEVQALAADPYARSNSRHSAGTAILKRKPVWWGGGFKTTPLYNRDHLLPGASLKGPAVVVEYSSTTAIPPGWVGRVDEGLNLVISKA
jgi:N-methylhydantoinase A